MKHRITLTVCLLLGLMLAISPSLMAQESARDRFDTIESYTVYYGKGRVEDLARFDLAIVQPDTLTAEELTDLKARGTLVIAYLSIGEAEPEREWYTEGRVDPAWE